MPSHNPNLRSIYAMLAAAGLFSLMDTAMKLLSETYPAMQVTALRALSSLPLVCLYLLYRGAFKHVLKVRWPLHFLRGALGIAMITLFAYGLKRLSLAEAYSLFFIAPLLITALSVPVLKERVPQAHWWAIGVGFIGVLVAIRPSGGDLQAGFATTGGIAVIIAAFCYAVAAVAGRLLSRTDSTESLILTMMLFMSVGGGLLAWSDWKPVSLDHTALLLALAVTGFLGQLTINEAFRSGQASAVAPFEYTALAWGVGLDWLIWQTLPGAHTWFGAAIIVGSGLYLVRREQRISEVHANAEHP